MTGQRAVSWVASAAIAVGSVVLFNSSSHVDAGATTQPAADVAAPDAATTQPAQQTASVTPEARKILDQVKQAYAGLKSLDVSGTMASNFDVDGQQQKNTADFKGSFLAGGKFRNETKEDMVIGYTGEKLYVFLKTKNAFAFFDSPQGKVDLNSINSDLADALRQGDMSLALALAPDAASELVGTAATVSRIADVKLDNTDFPALLISQKAMDMTLLVDPQNHLIRRQSLDLTKLAKLRGAQDVKQANVAIDFKNVPDAKIADDQFAWTPPEGAQEIHQRPADAATQLKGHPAPAFTLDDLNGKKIESTKLKGSVYILDFWATWCGPCCESLPGLDQIYKDEKAAGLKVFAIDQGEDKDTVQKFVNKTGLSIPALLDSDSKVGQAYGANAIPETVLVGRDGKIIEVFVGGGQDDAIRAAAVKALKGL